jgi:hypothetical protein
MSFDADGKFQGLLENKHERPIVIDGLWGLAFGNGGKAGVPGTLYFTAGPVSESHGLFGSLELVPEPRHSHGHYHDGAARSLPFAPLSCAAYRLRTVSGAAAALSEWRLHETSNAPCCAGCLPATMSASRQVETDVSVLSNAGALALASARWELARAAPSRGRKVAFCLIAGMLSVVCVEVPAGSTMFPFFTVWGLLVVWPLYLLHSVFLAGVVFRWGKPGFWPLYAAGMLYGMYEAYITKVVWVSFRPEGPFFSAGGIALFETIILVLFLHALLAFVVPLLFTEMLLTNSAEVFLGLPRWTRNSIRAHPMVWLGSLMAMFGLMQFVNSPSVWSSLWSGAGNGLVIGLAVLWWRRSGGTRYSLRELLPGPTGLRTLGGLLLAWYVFWGIAIKPKSIPPILHGQMTVWLLYAALLLIFYRCLVRSRQAPAATGEGATIVFGWRGFLLCCGLATAVTTGARLLVHQFAVVQMAVFFGFYIVVGLALLGGAVRYATGRLPP